MLLTGLLFFACRQEPKTVHKFFSMDSLVTAQIRSLRDLNPTLVKEAQINDKRETITLSISDTVGWKKEFDLYRQLEINKSINVDSYRVEDHKDPSSNLMIREYTATKDLPVVYLKVYYNKHIQDVKKIEGLFHEANALYTSERYLTMEFDRIKNEPMILSYTSVGGQKMFMGDSVNYSVTTSMTYP